MKQLNGSIITLAGFYGTWQHNETKRMQTGALPPRWRATIAGFLAPPRNIVRVAKFHWIRFNMASGIYLSFSVWLNNAKKTRRTENFVWGKAGLTSFTSLLSLRVEVFTCLGFGLKPTTLKSLKTFFFSLYKRTYIFRLKDMTYHLVLLLCLWRSWGSLDAVLWGCAWHAAPRHQDHDVPNIGDIGYSPQRVVHHRLLQGKVSQRQPSYHLFANTFSFFWSV